MSIDFNITPGVDATTPATPSIDRATNVPSIELFTVVFVGIQIVTFADWTNPVAIEDDGGSGRLFIFEANSAGSFYMFQSGGTTRTFFADSYTGWAAYGAVGTAANIVGYSQRPGGAFTATTTMASPAGANNYTACGTEFYFAGSMNGRYRWKGFKFWNASLTASQVQNEFWSLEPKRWSNLIYWNPGFFAASCNEDFSNTGGDYSLNGLGTDNAEDPEKPWMPQRAYGYVMAA